MNGKIKNCTLIVSRDCNLNCSYCYERHKDRLMMDFATAKACVLKEIDRSKSTDVAVLHITFMGGEPFLNFPVVRKIVEWIETVDVGLRFEASATTNGTLITPAIQAWLRRYYSIFKVQVSYDGDVLMQQRNRTKKFVDLDFFVQTFPIQGVHVTVSQQTVSMLSHGVLFLLGKGAKCSTTLAFGTKWTEQDADAYLRELRILSDVYLTKCPEVDPLPVLTRSMALVGSKPIEKSFGALGEDEIAYDVDGTEYPNHFFSPIVAGGKHSCKLSDFDIAKLGGTDDPNCRACPLCNWCDTCYGANYFLTGNTGLKDHSVCKMMVAQALVASEYQIKRAKISGVKSPLSVEAIRAYRVLRNLR